MIPARTSPVPPEARAGVATGFKLTRPSGAAITVPAPLRTTTLFQVFANREAIPRRSFCTALVSTFASRPNSAG